MKGREDMEIKQSFLKRIKTLPGYTATSRFMSTLDGYDNDGAKMIGWAKVKTHDRCQGVLCGCLKPVYSLAGNPVVVLDGMGRDSTVFGVEAEKVIPMEMVPV